MENKDELKEIDIKNCICYYLGDIKFQDRDIEFSDILLGKKSYKENYKNILVYNISYKTSTGAKPLRIRFNKTDGLLKPVMDLDVQYYLITVIVIKFVIRLDIL